jgi:hypothetical protein
MFKDRFVRTEDNDGYYASANDDSGITIMVPKLEGIKTQLFFRRIIKQNCPDGNKTLLVANVENVFLYVTEDNKFILTTNGELR